MQQYVNDFLTVNAGLILPPDTASQYINITGFNSVTIVNTGIRRFWLTGRSFIIQPYQKFYINGQDGELLSGNLYIEFLKGNSKASALFIRKKFIPNAKL